MAKLSEISNDNGRRESLLIHDETDDTPHDLTYDEFLTEYERDKKNLYDKLLQVHQEFYGVSMEKDVKIAELELQTQEKDGELTTLRSDKEEVNQQLTDAENERDAFATQMARMMMNRTSSAQQSSHVAVPSKSAKIPDPPLLTDGKEPRFDD